jgi:hypothetical protein
MFSGVGCTQDSYWNAAARTPVPTGYNRYNDSGVWRWRYDFLRTIVSHVLLFNKNQGTIKQPGGAEKEMPFMTKYMPWTLRIDPP